MSAVPSRSLMSIGEVLTQLRSDFPDVTISKIRFLESEGLVEPARTPSGYRKFSHADVGRLHYVLATQRDHYLPLRVIKEHLDALDRGLEPPAIPGGRPQAPTSAGRPDWAPGPRALGETTELRLSRDKQYMYLSIPIDEGPVFTIGSVNFKGDLIGSAQKNLDKVHIRAGMKFSRTLIAEDREALSNYYPDFPELKHYLQQISVMGMLNLRA